MIDLTLIAVFVDAPDTEIELVVRPSSQVMFERHFNIGVGEIGKNFEHMYWLAWHTCKRLSDNPRGFIEFDPWLETLISLDVKEVPDPKAAKSLS